MKSVFTDSVFSTFHMTPFEQFWTTADGRSVWVYSEAYMSPRMLDAHEETNSLLRDPEDNYERVIASLMIWSDTTHLANFGDASLWPVYLFFGSQSKYIRGKPSSAACHHVAYIPSVSSTKMYYIILINCLVTGQLPRSLYREIRRGVDKQTLHPLQARAYACNMEAPPRRRLCRGTHRRYIDPVR